MSVAPEIARLAETLVFVPASPAAGLPGPLGPDPLGHAPGARLTLGTLSRRLRMIAATPERWWSLVRFEPDRPVTVVIDGHPGVIDGHPGVIDGHLGTIDGHLGTIDGHLGYQAWLMVLPPGDLGQPCHCDVATMVAGEAVEGADASAILRPGPVRVHGQPHWLRGRGTGYSISLHARALPAPQPAPYGRVRIS
jgi:hypothetical protein